MIAAIASTMLFPVPRWDGDDWAYNEPVSVRDQSQWPVRIWSFQNSVGDPEKIQTFNCAITEAWDGKFALVVRHNKGIPGSSACNWIAMFQVAWPSLEVYGKKDLTLLHAMPQDQFEDPRAIFFNNQILVSGASFRKGGRPHQFIASINRNGVSPQVIHPVYGGNGPGIMRNTRAEKNWAWFENSGRLSCVYDITRGHEVFDWDQGRVVKTHRSNTWFKWKWGLPRGGSCPKRVGDEYFAFFHSSITEPAHRHRRYVMGAYAFESKPPYRITRASRRPILVGTHRDVHHESQGPAVFPCGAVLKSATWIVTFGVNDYQSANILIPHDELLDTMTQGLDEMPPGAYERRLFYQNRIMRDPATDPHEETEPTTC